MLLRVEASLNEGALTLVNAGQPCLRIIFDLKAELQKKKTDWRLELGLGALQAFGLGGQVCPLLLSDVYCYYWYSNFGYFLPVHTIRYPVW